MIYEKIWIVYTRICVIVRYIIIDWAVSKFWVKQKHILWPSCSFDFHCPGSTKKCCISKHRNRYLSMFLFILQQSIIRRRRASILCHIHLRVDGKFDSNTSSRSTEVARLISGPASCSVLRPACSETVFAISSFNLSIQSISNFFFANRRKQS